MSEAPLDDPVAPKWRPLDHHQRRVLGVLIEKAKTTPEGYPMSLNAITNGANQKSNRAPQMQLDAEDVEVALEELREMGAVGEIQGSGRVLKYRHYGYEWLGVDKFEVAVMAELLLRGEQTVGELRGRAARMEHIKDVAELRPILQSLFEKGLAVSLTPEGRGQIVTHNLFLDDEHESPKKQGVASSAAPPSAASSSAASSSAASSSAAPSPPTASSVSTPTSAPHVQAAAAPSAALAAAPAAVTRDMFAELQVEVAELQAEVARIRQRVRELEDQVGG